MFKSRTFGYALFFVLLIGAGFALGTHSTPPKPIAFSDLGRCLIGKDPAANAKCIQTSIASLLQTHSAAEIMHYVSASTTPTAILYDCHPIGHVVGTDVYKKYGSIEAALAQCTSDCRSACTHGVIGAGVAKEMGEVYPDEDIAHASTAQLEAVGKRYCDQSLATCHAIGHVAYIATQDPVKAVHLCDASAHGARLESCYEGAFMERAGTFYSVLSPADSITSPPIRSGDYTFPCKDLDDKYKQACYMFAPYYQQPLFAADGIIRPEDKHAKEVAVCEALPLPDRTLCLEGMGTVSFFFGTQGLSVPQMNAFCDQLPTLADREGCTKGILMQYLYFDRMNGIAYCESIQEASRRTYCYTTTFRKREQNEVFSGDVNRMCGDSTACATRYTQYLASSTTSVSQ